MTDYDDKIADAFDETWKPRFNILDLTLRVPVESFETSTGDERFTTEATRGTKYRHSAVMGWGFEVHTRDADLIMKVTPMTATAQIDCSLHPWCAEQLLKEQVVYLDTPSFGIVVVTVPRFCKKDEAKSLVRDAFRNLMQTAHDRSSTSEDSAKSFKDLIDASKKKQAEKKDGK